MPKTKVACIITTWNRKSFMEKTLVSLLTSFRKIKPDIFIFDDFSTDGTKETLEPYVKKHKIYYERFPENMGLRNALNFALNMVTGMGYDYISYNQDDVLFKKGWLDECVEHWNRPNIDFYTGSKIGFITGHEAPEHRTINMVLEAVTMTPGKTTQLFNTPVDFLLKESCRATHLFASTERWKLFGEIPDLTPGIAAPKPGQGSMVDWWLVGHPEGKYPESDNSLRKRGEKVLVLPGRVRHMATDRFDSTWNNPNTEVW